MTLELVKDEERVVVSLDDIVGSLEAGHQALVVCAILVVVRVWRSKDDRHGRVLLCPLEEGVRLAPVHVLWQVEHDNVVVRLHLERDPASVRLARSTKDEFELDVVGRHA